MKLKYGNNAAGKTVYADAASSKGKLVLYSDMKGWKDGKTLSQFAQDKKDQKNILNDIKSQIFSASLREGLGYEGKNATFKGLLSKNSNFTQLFESVANIDAVPDITNLIQIGALDDQLLNVEIMDSAAADINELTDVEFLKYIGLSKFYASLKAAVKSGDEPLIVELNSLKATADGELESITNNEIKSLVKKGNEKILNVLRTETNPGQTIRDNVVADSIKNIKFLKGDEIKAALVKLEKYETEAITFNPQQQTIDRIQSEYDIEISFSSDHKSFTYSGDLSNGQFTMLSAEIIIESVSTTNDMILDDVLETLDDGNSYDLVNEIINNPNVEILTHSSSIAALVDKVEDETGIEVESKNFNDENIVYSWRKLLAETRNSDDMDDNKLFTRSLIKIVSRYIAKDSAIHANPGYALAASVKASEQWKHWSLAGRIFHYHPSLNVSELQIYFPWLVETSTDISSIEFVDKILSKIDTIDPAGDIKIFNLSLQKIKQFFSEIKNELIIEKQIFDAREATNSDATSYFWGNQGETFRKYRDCRASQSRPKRNNKLMHLIDMSPIPFI